MDLADPGGALEERRGAEPPATERPRAAHSGARDYFMSPIAIMSISVKSTLSPAITQQKL